MTLQSDRQKIRRRMVIQLIFITILLTGLAIIAITSGIFTPKDTARSVTLKVVASHGFIRLSYSTPEESSASALNVSSPWEKTFRLQAGDEVHISAGNPNSIGEITCYIIINNRVWRSETAKYPDDKAACAGIIP